MTLCFSVKVYRHRVSAVKAHGISDLWLTADTLAKNAKLLFRAIIQEITRRCSA